MKMCRVVAIFATTLAFAASANAKTVLQSGEFATDPVLVASGATLDYFEFFGDADLSGFGIPVDGSSGELSLALGWTIADPSQVFGGFAVDTIETTLLQGDLSSVGFVDDTLEFRMGNIGGDMSNAFGSAVLLEIDLGIDLTSGIGSLDPATSYSADITFSRIAAVPIPATLPLSILAMFSIFALGRRNWRQYSVRDLSFRTFSQL